MSTAYDLNETPSHSKAFGRGGAGNYGEGQYDYAVGEGALHPWKSDPNQTHDTGRGGAGNIMADQPGQYDTTGGSGPGEFTGHAEGRGGYGNIEESEKFKHDADGGKVSIGDKVKGTVEQIGGKLLRNEELAAKGAERKNGGL